MRHYTYHISHGSKLLVSPWLPDLGVSGKSNVVGPLDKVVVGQSFLTNGQISLSESVDEPGIVVTFSGGEPGSIWRQALEAGICDNSDRGVRKSKKNRNENKIC